MVKGRVLEDKRSTGADDRQSINSLYDDGLGRDKARVRAATASSGPQTASHKMHFFQSSP
jgi:hypothetical protein